MSTLVFYFGGLVGVICAIYYRSIIPIFIFILIWLFALIAPAITTPGIAVSEEQAVENKRNGNIFLLVILSIAILAVLYTNYVHAL